jgi:CBS-domain-containing membrane protein
MDLLSAYFYKMRGATSLSSNRFNKDFISFHELFWAFLGSFIGIGLLSYLHSNWIEAMGSSLLIGSFGASAVLIYGAPASPLAQPRNLIGGHVVSAFTGVAVKMLIPGDLVTAAALAVSLAIIFMLLTLTLHPPGGATALIAIIGGESIYRLGFYYVLMPVGTGATIMLIVALLINNIPRSRRYPDFWF